MTKTWLAVFLTCLVPCLPVLGQNVPISEQLDKEESFLQELEKRAEESMRLIVQDENPHSKLAAFSSQMTKQSQELKAVKNFELLCKAITEKKKELAENQRISSNLRSVAEGKLEESAKRLEQLKQRASTLQKRLEQMEQSADQWAAGYSQMRQIDEKEALEQLRQSIQLELKDIGSKKPIPESTRKPPDSEDREHVVSSNSKFPISSYWSHNGSIMGLVVEGKNRTIVYAEVRGGLAKFVKPGSVLFSGISNGNQYKGKAFRFSENLPPIDYEVEGPIMNKGSQVVLTGKAPIRNSDGVVVRYLEDRLEFLFLRPNK